jgi:hypothetical protein
MKQREEIKKRFDEFYKGKRILAVDLNGFSHRVWYDNGSKDSEITIEEYSPWMTMPREKIHTKKLLGSYSTYDYKGNPLGIVYLNPEER